MVAMSDPALFAHDQSGTRIAVKLGPVIGSGGAGVVFRDASDSGYAIKLYESREKANSLKAKLEAMIRNPLPWARATSHGRVYVQLAWPTDLIELDDGQIVGVRMPYLPSNESDDVEFLLRPHTRREHMLDERFALRIVAAGNLAALVDKLHAAGYCMPDLKPANIRIYRDSSLLAVFDCDGMGVFGAGGRRFLAGEATPEYMAPEAKGDPGVAGASGPPQDQFALAVTIFQLMNEGLHPFQGVPIPGMAVPHDNQQRIDLGLYPHGRQSLANMKSNLQSLHPWFEERTVDLFERAFGKASGRPTAAEWSEHLRELAPGSSLGLRACPEGSGHLHFSKGCGHCELKKRLGHYPWDIPETGQIGIGSQRVTRASLAAGAIQSTIVTALSRSALAAGVSSGSGAHLGRVTPQGVPVSKAPMSATNAGPAGSATSLVPPVSPYSPPSPPGPPGGGVIFGAMVFGVVGIIAALVYLAPSTPSSPTNPRPQPPIEAPRSPAPPPPPAPPSNVPSEETGNAAWREAEQYFNRQDYARMISAAQKAINIWSSLPNRYDPRIKRKLARAHAQIGVTASDRSTICANLQSARGLFSELGDQEWVSRAEGSLRQKGCIASTPPPPAQRRPCGPYETWASSGCSPPYGGPPTGRPIGRPVDIGRPVIIGR